MKTNAELFMFFKRKCMCNIYCNRRADDEDRFFKNIKKKKNQANKF